MKYSCEITIDRPRTEVVQLFDSVDNLYHWMEGLQKFEHLSGSPGEVGAESRLVFQMGKRKMEMIETITEKSLPDSMSGTYTANGVVNHIRNEFIEADTQTIYRTYQEFELKGVMRLFGLLFPGMFKRQSMKYLTSFKEFVENR